MQVMSQHFKEPPYLSFSENFKKMEETEETRDSQLAYSVPVAR